MQDFASIHSIIWKVGWWWDDKILNWLNQGFSPVSISEATTRFHDSAACAATCECVCLVVTGTCFMFPYFGNHHLIWLIFFRGVETYHQPGLVFCWSLPANPRLDLSWSLEFFKWPWDVMDSHRASFCSHSGFSIGHGPSCWTKTSWEKTYSPALPFTWCTYITASQPKHNSLFLVLRRPAVVIKRTRLAQTGDRKSKAL